MKKNGRQDQDNISSSCQLSQILLDKVLEVSWWSNLPLGPFPRARLQFWLQLLPIKGSYFSWVDKSKCEFYVNMKNSTQWRYFLSINQVTMYAKKGSLWRSGLVAAKVIQNIKANVRSFDGLSVILMVTKARENIHIWVTYIVRKGSASFLCVFIEKVFLFSFLKYSE